MLHGRGERSSPGRVDGSSRAMLATARPSCSFSDRAHTQSHRCYWSPYGWCSITNRWLVVVDHRWDDCAVSQSSQLQLCTVAARPLHYKKISIYPQILWGVVHIFTESVLFTFVSVNQCGPTLNYSVNLWINVQGTGCIKIWKTCQKMSADIRIFFTAWTTECFVVTAIVYFHVSSSWPTAGSASGCTSVTGGGHWWWSAVAVPVVGIMSQFSCSCMCCRLFS